MVGLLQAAAAPVFIGLFYMYVRDKYEKEPYFMLFIGLLYGVYATFVIWPMGMVLERVFPHVETALFSAFFSSAGVEESVKFLFLYFLVWRNPNFNEPFDGMVYAVFICLGFALVENIIYVFHRDMGGFDTALARAVFSVPGHGLFGLQMGFYLAKAKFYKNKKYLFLAFLIPYILHGIYNYILFWDEKIIWLPFIAFSAFLWIFGLKRMKMLLELSPFKK